MPKPHMSGHGPAWALFLGWPNDFEKRSGVKKILKNTRETMIWRNDFATRVWGKNDLGQMLGKSNWKHDCEQTILVKTDFEDCSGKSDLEKRFWGKRI